MFRDYVEPILRGLTLGLVLAVILNSCPSEQIRIAILLIFFVCSLSYMIYLTWKIKRAQARIDDDLLILDAMRQLTSDEMSDRLERLED